MNKFLAFFSIITIIGLTGSVSAVSEEQIPQQRVDNATTGVTINQGDIYQKGLLTQFSDTLFSFSGVQDTYEPGEEVDITLETETTNSFNTADATKVVTVYKCADSSCEDPAPVSDPTDDSCSSEEFWPTYDDCIARNTDDFENEYDVRFGATYWYDTSFSGFEDEATYILQGYIYTWTSSDGWQQVTDVSEEKFDVEDPQSGDDGSDDSNDDTTTDPEPEPQIQAVTNPNVAVDKDTGEVNGQVTFENTGGDMNENYIVEMQVRDESGGLLSFIGNQDTCDPDQPANVHKEFNLNSGEQATINLNTQVDPTGEDFQIRFVTATDCIANGGDGSLIEPYNGGNYYTETRQIGFDEPEISAYREPEITVNNESDKVTGTVYLENSAGPMQQRDIVEMQIKTTDDNFLSFVESQTDVCDPDHPENVHKEFRLDDGARESITLESQVPESGTYDVVFLTVDQCGLGDDSRGFVDPYNGYTDEFRFTDVTVGDTSDGSTDPGDGADEGGNNLPILMIGLGVLMLVIGGVFYRYG